MKARLLVARLALWAIGLAGALGSAVLHGQTPPQANPAATAQYAAAVAAQGLEDFEQAAKEWDKFLAAYSNDPRAGHARHYLGVCRLKSKQYEAAIQQFERLIAESPKFELLESTYLYLAIAQLNAAKAGGKNAAEQYAQAAQTLSTLVAKFPRGQHLALATYYQGEVAYERGDRRQAATYYAQLVKQFPQDAMVANALYNEGVVLEELADYAAADACYATFLKAYPQHAWATEVGMRRGDILFAQGKFADAEQRFATAAAQKGFAMADLATMRQAAAAGELRQYARAADLYLSVPAKYAQSPRALEAWLLAGKCDYLAGNYERARTSLAKVPADGSPSATEATHWLARILLKEHQPAEALRTLDRALKQKPAGPFAAKLELDRADALYDQPERRAEAAKLYGELATAHARDEIGPEALYLAAFAALGTEDYAAAAAHARQFGERYPQHELAADVLFIAAESRLKQNDQAGAEPLYAEFLKKYPTHHDAGVAQVHRGYALFLQKKYRETIAALEPGVARLGSKDLAAEAQYLLGRSHAELGESAAAVRALEASLAADPKSAQADEALLAMAQAYRADGQLAKAKASLTRVVHDYPRSGALDRAHYRLGECEFAAGAFSAAAAEFRRVVDDHADSPLVPFALFNLASALRNQGDQAGAVAALDRLLGKYAGHELAARARLSRALSRQQLKQYAAASEDCQAFLKSNPAPAERAEARYVLGLCQAGLNHPDEAVASFAQALKDDPRYPAADQVLYDMAWTQKTQGKVADAVATFERLATEYPDSKSVAESWYHVAERRFADEKFDTAEKAYRRAMEKAGKSELGEKAAYQMALCMFRLQEWDRARQTFNYQRLTFPTGELAADGAFMEGESWFKQGKFREALGAYAAVKQAKRPELAVLAALHSGQAAAQMSNWKESLALLATAEKLDTDAKYLPEIIYEQAWARQNLDELDEALKLYETVTAKTDREVAARARFMIGEIYFQRKNHSEAVSNFLKAAYGYSYPEWQANAFYEAGRCYEVLGKLEQAKKVYQQVVEKHAQSDKAPLARQRLAALAG